METNKTKLNREILQACHATILNRLTSPKIKILVAFSYQEEIITDLEKDTLEETQNSWDKAEKLLGYLGRR